MRTDLTHSFYEIVTDLEHTRVNCFPRLQWENGLKKLQEEAGEVLLAPRSKRPEEYADVFICWYNALRADGFDISEVLAGIAFKGAVVNLHRKQKMTEEGVYQHVKGE